MNCLDLSEKSSQSACLLSSCKILLGRKYESKVPVIEQFQCDHVLIEFDKICRHFLIVALQCRVGAAF